MGVRNSTRWILTKKEAKKSIEPKASNKIEKNSSETIEQNVSKTI